MAARGYTRSPNSPTDEEKPSDPMLGKSPPPPEAFNVQLPREQIYQGPPPARGTPGYYRRIKGRSRGCSCCRCLCCLLCFIFSLVILLGLAVLIFYLVVRPQIPSYSINNLSVGGISNTTTTLSSSFDISVLANNTNTKIGIYYESGSSVTVSTSNLSLSNGSLPVFYQPTKNATVFTVTTNGTVPYTSALATALELQSTTPGKIPLLVNVLVPAKLKIGALTTWKFWVSVNCNVVINALQNASVLSKSCAAKLQKLW